MQGKRDPRASAANKKRIETAYNVSMTAAKETTGDVLSLAAVCFLPKTRVWVSTLKNST
jgi:hypothetical protein